MMQTTSPSVTAPTAIEKIAVIGLGYVGLPLAVNLAKYYDVTGFDINTQRIDELRTHHDMTREVAAEDLAAVQIHYTAALDDIKNCSCFIVTVPTPIDDQKRPDLTPLRKACQSLGPVLKKGDIVVFESTVYPGVTEKICGPILAELSGLVSGQDFFLGYSPERINPGDKIHTVDKITKVVAGQNDTVTKMLGAMYGKLNGDNIFLAQNIATAETAKAIENAQRDINIAFVNEVAMICQKVGLSVHDVLAAAGSKWNFLPFTPGLVGGHCIGVDPYYLAECAIEHGHHPQMILAGREINDGMGQYWANRVHEKLGKAGGKILILGLTFKEDIPDLRNSKVVDLYKGLQNYGHQIDIHDAEADHDEALQEYKVNLLANLPTDASYDAVILAVPHRPYREWKIDDLAKLLKKEGLLADPKGHWQKLARNQKDFPFIYWSL